MLGKFNKIVSISVLLALIAISTVAFAIYSASTLVSMTNDQRSQSGVAALTVNSALTNAATAKANDMFAKGYFAHTSPEGKTPWDFIHEAGYNYTYAGENLAIGYSDATDLMNDWMNSPTHRENILNLNFKEIGIAVVSGKYNGIDTIIAVQEFGTSITQVQSTQDINAAQPISTNRTISTINLYGEKSKINPASIFAGEEVEFTVTFSGDVKKLELGFGNLKFNVLDGQKIATSGTEVTYILKEKIDQVGKYDVIVTAADISGNQKTINLGKLEIKPTVINKENNSLFAGFHSTGSLVGLIILSGLLITGVTYLILRKIKFQKILKPGTNVWEF